jgi:hypothetical protein
MQDFDVNHKKIDESIEKEEQLFNPQIHILGYSDNWECDRCSLKGGIHFIRQHACIKN